MRYINQLFTYLLTYLQTEAVCFFVNSIPLPSFSFI